MYGLQHGALAYTEQQSIKGPKITSVKQFKQENQWSNLYKNRETRNTYELHKQMTTTVLCTCTSDSFFKVGLHSGLTL